VLESVHELWDQSLCRFVLAPVTGMQWCAGRTAVLVGCSAEEAADSKVLSCKCLFNFRLVSPRAYPRPSLCQWLFVTHSLSAAALCSPTIAGRFTELDAMLSLPGLRRVDERF
jgi:hypothetical protein